MIHKVLKMNILAKLFIIFFLFVPCFVYSQATSGNDVVVEVSKDKILVNNKSYFLHKVKKTSSPVSLTDRNTAQPVTVPPPEEHTDHVATPNTSKTTKQQDSGSNHDNVIKKQTSPKSTFCVQVVSARDKKDAEAVKARLAARGLAAYVVESKLQDRGVW